MELKDIDRNSKEYKEAAWFINRLIDFDTLSHKEIIRICEVAVVLSKSLHVEETIEKIEVSW